MPRSILCCSAFALAVVASLAAAPHAAGQGQGLNGAMAKPEGSQPAGPALSQACGDLETRLSALEAKLADQQREPGGLEWHDTSGQQFTQRWTGRIMGDGVLIAGQDSASLAAFGNQSNYFEFRSVRIAVDGQGYGVFDYKLELELEPEFGGAQAVRMRDLHVGIAEIPWFGYVRLGNFKEPFSLEQMYSRKFITFLERSLADVFVPRRHVGMCAYQHTADERFTWAFGAFIQDVDQDLKERVDDNQGIDLPVRVTWNPIYTAGGRGVLHLGLGYVWTDDRDDLLRFAVAPETHEMDAFIDTGILTVSDYHRLGGELAVVYGPFSVQSELIYVAANGIAGLADQDFCAAYLFGSWFLTGEHRVYKRASGAFARVKPNTNFWLVRTVDQDIDWGWGAWELAIRWSYLDLTTNGIPRPQRNGKNGLANNLTLGLNWYWNPHMRLMFNYIHSWASVVDTIGLADGVADTDILSMRMQVDF